MLTCQILLQAIQVRLYSVAATARDIANENDSDIGISLASKMAIDNG